MKARGKKALQLSNVGVGRIPEAHKTTALAGTTFRAKRPLCLGLQ